MAHAPRPRKKNDNNSTVMLMLGLFLILLAFFILLNAISELVEERVEQASQGVMSGFGFQKSARKTPDVSSINIKQIHDRTAKRIKETFETYMSVKDFSFERRDPETTIVQMNPHQFFRQGEWRLKTSQALFFKSLSEVLAEENPGYHLSVDIRMPELNEEAPEGGQNLTALALGGYRATQFARALAERDVSPLHLTTGVSEEQKHWILMVFKNNITDKQAAISTANRRERGR